MGRRAARWLSRLVMALLPGLAACATTGSGDPVSTLHSYARALEEGRVEDAYRLLSDEARRGVSFEAFKHILESSPEDAREIGRSLSRPTAPAFISATVTAPSGETLQLVWSREGWKVDVSAIDLYKDDTPRHAIEGYLRALEHKRYDVLLRYAPEQHLVGLDEQKLKAAWEGPDKEEVQQAATALKRALPTASIEETGDHAQMSYGPGTVRLVREHGRWKVEDVE